MGKKQQDAAARYDRAANYSPTEALGLAKSLAHAGFDETVEAAFNLGIDARQADQIVRARVTLPHGTGKKVRVLCLRRRREGSRRPGGRGRHRRRRGARRGHHRRHPGARLGRHHRHPFDDERGGRSWDASWALAA